MRLVPLDRYSQPLKPEKVCEASVLLAASCASRRSALWRPYAFKNAVLHRVADAVDPFLHTNFQLARPQAPGSKTNSKPSHGAPRPRRQGLLLLRGHS